MKKKKNKQSLEVIKNQINVEVSGGEGMDLNIVDGTLSISGDSAKEFAESDDIQVFVEQKFIQIKEKNEETTNESTRRLEETSTINSSGGSNYYYTSEGSLNLIDIATEAGLSYEVPDDILADASSLTQDAADSFQNNETNESKSNEEQRKGNQSIFTSLIICLLYTSPSPRD